jgi:diguanylate cyclase (GGDEF)-like protein
MIVPIKLGDKVIGVINMADKLLNKNLSKKSKLNYEEVFDDLDLRFLCTIARELSVALENVELLKELNSLVVTDPLVNIYNYRQFSRSLDYEMKRCRRNNITLCIIMIDIDDFKPYNDTFGHLEGDALLRNLGKIFKDQLREVDVVCRYAGDEFAIILPDTDVHGAEMAAQKIQNAVKRFSFKKEVTLSYGIARCVGDCTQHDLIHNADKSLYQAKQAGKNCIRVFE